MKSIEIAVVPATWVKGNLLPALFGLTPEAARKKRYRGEWLEDKHYKMAPDGNYVYNWREIDKWYGGAI
jgi:hypothetical protein